MTAVALTRCVVVAGGGCPGMRACVRAFVRKENGRNHHRYRCGLYCRQRAFLRRGSGGEVRIGCRRRRSSSRSRLFFGVVLALAKVGTTRDPGDDEDDEADEGEGEHVDLDLFPEHGFLELAA
eukprot:CAMPEP_0197424464 /NCGR_PEP_ID=MMETSP1170-20131217/26264_1 /TAXON_ID=54406 /ORGANISM="Sarcinochrysis sp, Strain CCMP770" /LENGTH=122 /DNA_ID=CAMNT_0042951947 /DNA_START=66 /DNA_END=431 /DNA_ORIENTATION=-